MYVTINRFALKPGAEDRFEALWRRQGANMDGVDGFLRFTLLREADATPGPGGAPPAPADDGASDGIAYSVIVEWDSAAAFAAWVRSPSFRAAHADLPDLTDLYTEPPVLTRYTAVDLPQT